MHDQPSHQFLFIAALPLEFGERAMTSVPLRARELAERASSGTRVRLLWRPGTKQLWVELRESANDRAVRIQVRPEQALDAFQHPYAYARPHHFRPPAHSLELCAKGRRAAGDTCHEQ
jgi:hypothetical protein